MICNYKDILKRFKDINVGLNSKIIDSFNTNLNYSILTDINQNFINKVKINYIVYNKNLDNYSLVVEIIDNNNILLSEDLFTEINQSYIIYKDNDISINTINECITMIESYVFDSIRKKIKSPETNLVNSLTIKLIIIKLVGFEISNIVFKNNIENIPEIVKIDKDWAEEKLQEIKTGKITFINENNNINFYSETNNYSLLNREIMFNKKYLL